MLWPSAEVEEIEDLPDVTRTLSTGAVVEERSLREELDFEAMSSKAVSGSALIATSAAH